MRKQIMQNTSDMQEILINNESELGRLSPPGLPELGQQSGWKCSSAYIPDTKKEQSLVPWWEKMGLIRLRDSLAAFEKHFCVYISREE